MSGKITANQEVVGGFDLASFVGDADGEPVATTDDKPKPAQSKPTKKPATPAGELNSERIQVMLTKKEHAAIVKKAGLVPVSKWLRHYLKEQGLI